MSESAEIVRLTQEEMSQELRSLFRGAVRLVLETVLEQEVKEMVGARRYERLGARKDRRNGTYLRRLLTSMGEIEVAMPRTREQGSPTEVIGSYRRRTEDLDDAICAAYVHGVSTRDMGKVTEALRGESVSRSTVSRVARQLDDQVEALRSRASTTLSRTSTSTRRSSTPAGLARSRTSRRSWHTGSGPTGTASSWASPSAPRSPRMPGVSSSSSSSIGA